MEHPRPDDKNWTWVLERPCPACRFDAQTIARHMIGATLRTTIEAWRTRSSAVALLCASVPQGRRLGGPSGPPSNMAATSGTCLCCSRSASG